MTVKRVTRKRPGLKIFLSKGQEGQVPTPSSTAFLLHYSQGTGQCLALPDYKITLYVPGLERLGRCWKSTNQKTSFPSAPLGNGPSRPRYRRCQTSARRDSINSTSGNEMRQPHGPQLFYNTCIGSGTSLIFTFISPTRTMSLHCSGPLFHPFLRSVVQGRRSSNARAKPLGSNNWTNELPIWQRPRFPWKQTAGRQDLDYNVCFKDAECSFGAKAAAMQPSHE